MASRFMCLDAAESRKRGEQMIYVTKLNNVEILLNEDLIEVVEETPDTIITLTTSKKLIVKETKEELYQKVYEYKNAIYH